LSNSFKKIHSNIKPAIAIFIAGLVCILFFLRWLATSDSKFLIEKFLPTGSLLPVLVVFWGLVVLVFLFIFQIKSINRIKLLFFVFMLSGIVGMVIAAYISHGETIRSFLHYDRKDTFMDYFNSIQYGFRPYKYKVIYPPLINVIYAILGHFNILTNDVIINSQSGFATRNTQTGWIIFSLYTAISYIGLAMVLFFTKKGSISEKNFFIATMFLSLPFVFAFERGNSIILTLVFILLFLKFYNSSNNKIKYLAFVSLGIAAGIKIVPALFGIILLKERRFKDALICVAIGIGTFMVPFLFTDGNLSILLANLNTTTAEFQGAHIDDSGSKILMGHGAYINLLNTAKFLGRLLNIDLVNIATLWNIGIVSFGVFGIILQPTLQQWKTVGVISGIIVLCAGFSAIYNLVYLIVPLVYFLDIEKHKTIDYIYLSLFVVMFVPVVNIKLGFFRIFNSDMYPLRISNSLESIALLLFVSLLVIDNYYQLFINKDALIQEKKKSSAAIAIILLVTLFGYVYGYKAKEPIEAFYPYNLDVGNASTGFALEEGLFGKVVNEASVKLQSKKLFKEGLVFCFNHKNKNTEDNINHVELYVNNKKLAEVKTIEKNMLYITPEQLRNNGISEDENSLLIKILCKHNTSVKEGKHDEGIDVYYIGPAKGLKEINYNTYIDEATAGLNKGERDGKLWLSGEANVLMDYETICKDGLRVTGEVPNYWQEVNVGIIPRLTITSAKEILEKTLPLAGKFEIRIPAEQICPIMKETFKNPIAISFSINGTFNTKTLGIDNESFAKSIIISSIGPDRGLHSLNMLENKEREAVHENKDSLSTYPNFNDCSEGFLQEGENYWLEGTGTIRLNSKMYKDTGIYLTYTAPHELFIDNIEIKPLLSIYVDNKLIHTDSIRQYNTYSDNVNGIFIPPSSLVNCGEKVNLKLVCNKTVFRKTQEKRKKAGFTESIYKEPNGKNQTVSGVKNYVSIRLNYIGYDGFPSFIDNKVNLLAFTSKVILDEQEKVLTIGKLGEFLLAPRDFLANGLLLKYEASPMLFQANTGEDLFFDMYINGHKVKTIPILQAEKNKIFLEPGELRPYITGQDQVMVLKIVSSSVYNEKTMRIRNYPVDISLKILSITSN